ncbi:MAG: hypothetical protein IK096_03815, partial [Lachnospiraceae bacterium]|nr:hypothetical protein [Lachnospiraceae bacterium]
VFYRKAYFNYRPEVECHWMQAVLLADLPVPCGILRADKMMLFKRPTRITLGSYGFPDHGTTVRHLNRDGAQAVVLTGQDACGKPRQMAMTIWSGFRELKVVHSQGTNPDSDRSVLICAEGEMRRQYDGSEEYIFLSQLITREDGADFTEDEIFPLAKVEYEAAGHTGAYGTVRLLLRDGREAVICYDGIEGRLSL